MKSIKLIYHEKVTGNNVGG